MLRNILRLNSLSCLIFGIIMVFFHEQTLEHLGTREYHTLVYVLGLVLLVNTFHLIMASFRKNLIKGEVLYFSIGDLGWVILTFALILFSDVITTFYGLFSSISVALMVLIFSILQYSKAKKLPMDQISVSQALKTSKLKVWQKLSDFQNIHNIHPMVKDAIITNEQNSGIGAKRVCTFTDNSKVKEEVIGWQEGKLLEVEIKEINMPLDYLANKIEVFSDNITTTTVFRAKNIFAEILIGFFMRPLLIKRLNNVNKGFNTEK